jgi:hypothetical protein
MIEKDKIPDDLSDAAERAKQEIKKEFNSCKKWSVACAIGAATAGAITITALDNEHENLAVASMLTGAIGAPALAIKRNAVAVSRSEKIVDKFHSDNDISFDGMPSIYKTVVSVTPRGNIEENSVTDPISLPTYSKIPYLGLGGLSITLPSAVIFNRSPSEISTEGTLASLALSSVAAVSLYLSLDNDSENSRAFCRQIDNLAKGNLEMEIPFSQTTLED